MSAVEPNGTVVGGPHGPSYPISSVDNALQVLAWLREQPLIGVRDVSDRLGLGRTTAHRLLNALDAEGFLQHGDVRGGYVAGPMLVHSATGAVDAMRIRRVARDPIRALRNATRETVELCILDGADVVVVDVAEGLQPLRVVDRPGDRLSAHLCAAGKAMLSNLESPRLRELSPSTKLARPTRRSVDDLDHLEAELREVARRGYATNQGEGQEDIVGIAAPVLGAAGAVCGAVTIALPGSAEPVDIDDLAASVVECAGVVGARLRDPFPVKATDVSTQAFLGKSPAGSVGNALRILSLLTSQSVVRVSSAADALGVAPGTAHRLIAMLVHRGFLVQATDSKAYMAGAVLVDIGLRLPPEFDLRTAARPHLEALTRATGETSAVAVAEGEDIRVVDVVAGTRRLQVVESVGTRAPARSSAAGKAILAALPSISPSASRDLTAELAEVARLGYATSRSEGSPEAVVVASAIRRSDGTVRGAVTLALPSSRWFDDVDDALVSAIRRAARLIEASLR